ncbi:hypothetical protein CR513_33324, partial [Mucuna pruriens]
MGERPSTPWTTNSPGREPRHKLKPTAETDYHLLRFDTNTTLPSHHQCPSPTNIPRQPRGTVVIRTDNTGGTQGGRAREGGGGITRSGRIYTPENLRSQEAHTSSKETHAPTRKASAAYAPAQTPKKEAEEFLKIIRHREHQFLDQMNKTLARISLLSLLLNFEAHRNLLLNVLQEAHVAHDITTERFGSLVNNITSRGHLIFFDDEIPVEGRSHN